MSVIQFNLPARNRVSRETELYNQDVENLNIRAYAEGCARYRFLVLTLEPRLGILGYTLQVSYTNRRGQAKIITASMNAIPGQPGNFEVYLKVKCIREGTTLNVTITPLVT